MTRTPKPTPDRIAPLRRRVNALESDLTSIEGDVLLFDKRLTALETRVATLETRQPLPDPVRPKDGERPTVNRYEWCSGCHAVMTCQLVAASAECAAIRCCHAAPPPAAAPHVEPEPGETIGHFHCPSCGVYLEVMHGDEPGEIGGLTVPDDKTSPQSSGAGKDSDEFRTSDRSAEVRSRGGTKRVERQGHVAFATAPGRRIEDDASVHLHEDHGEQPRPVAGKPDGRARGGLGAVDGEHGVTGSGPCDGPAAPAKPEPPTIRKDHLCNRCRHWKDGACRVEPEPANVTVAHEGEVVVSCSSYDPAKPEPPRVKWCSPDPAEPPKGEAGWHTCDSCDEPAVSKRHVDGTWWFQCRRHGDIGDVPLAPPSGEPTRCDYVSDTAGTRCTLTSGHKSPHKPAMGTGEPTRGERTDAIDREEALTVVSNAFNSVGDIDSIHGAIVAGLTALKSSDGASGALDEVAAKLRAAIPTEAHAGHTEAYNDGLRHFAGVVLAIIDAAVREGRGKERS